MFLSIPHHALEVEASLDLCSRLGVVGVEARRLPIRVGGNFASEEIILRNVLKLSGDLGLYSLTEGVETEDQANFLKESGCDIFQGFYFSKPISVEDFEKKYCQGGQK